MDMKQQLASALFDKAVFDEIRDGEFMRDVIKDPLVESLGPAAAPADPADLRAAADRMRSGHFDPDHLSIAEAIIVRFGYPSLLVQNGTYTQPALKIWRERLNPYEDEIRRAIAATGRIELTNFPASWLGTGWMIDEYTVVTNRHVAKHFVSGSGSSVSITSGIDAFIDYREEHGGHEDDRFVAGVVGVTAVEPTGSDVDIAFLRLGESVLDRFGIEPIALAHDLEAVGYIGVVGYPQFDWRNSPADQSRIFEDIYEKKRFAPGQITDASIRGGHAFAHNATTLGGNSGSCVVDVRTGHVVGLHYGGREGERNEAVRVGEIRDRAARLGITTRSGGGRRGPRAHNGGGGGDEAPPRGAQHYGGRNGYDATFLGSPSLHVPLPGLNALQERDTAQLSDGSIELKYQNFSIVMNRARRLAFFTAVNIDGTDLWHKPRGSDYWRIDPRIDEDEQVDNALYRSNDFDRGHIVRRLDPVWGNKTDAVRAEDDTFHYTNAVPQHKDLNRGIWVQLEDHLLSTADEADAKISVLCGPIFGYADPRSTRPGLEEVGIPLGFWKVIASIGRDRRNRRVLDAQAFVIWQHHMFGARDLEVVFGRGFETYQVAVAELERLCGLDFGPLREADTLGEQPSEETSAEMAHGRFVRGAVVVRTASDIV